MSARAIVALLVGALLTGAGAWVTWARTIPSKAEVIELIETRSPYVVDRKLLEDNAERQKRMEERLQDLEVWAQVSITQNAQLKEALERIERAVQQ